MKVKFFQKKKVDRNKKELFLITFVLPRRSISVEKLKKKKKEKVRKEVKYSIDKGKDPNAVRINRRRLNA